MPSTWTSVRALIQSPTTFWKLGRYGFDRWTLRWVRNWVDGYIQRVIVSGSISKWKPRTTGVLQGSILGSIPFNIFTNDRVGLSMHSASLQMIPKWQQSTHLRKVMSSRQTRRNQDRLWGDLPAAFKYIKGIYQKNRLLLPMPAGIGQGATVLNWERVCLDLT